MIQAVIMAGGKGTRLQTITRDEIPKPMAPLNGKPILQWQVEHLRACGVCDLIFIIGHLGEKICAYFGDGSTFGVSIAYVQEKMPLGTAGALALLPPLLKEERFFLIFGDVLFDIDLSRMERFHRDSQALATLFVHPNNHPFDSDLVVADEDGRITAFDSKHNVRDYDYANRVNAGFYLMERSICDHVPLPHKTDLEKELLTKLIAANAPIYAYCSPEYIKDVGTVERLTHAEVELRSGYVAGRNLAHAQRAIFLDRDGTVNKKNGLIFRAEQFELEPCAVEAIRRINRSGWLAILVTNQPVVARGLCSEDQVRSIHKKLETLLGQEGVFLDDICFCPHHPDKGYPEENPSYKISCHCRKPDIGMIESCVSRFHLDLQQCWMVGDTTVDIRTGKNAGTRTALVRTGDAGEDGKYDDIPDVVCEDLLQAVIHIIGD